MRRNILYFTFLLLGTLSRAQDADTNQAPETPDSPFQFTTSHGKDRVAVGGGSIHVKPGEVVHDVVVVGGSALIEGKVTGDCVVVFGKCKLTSTAEIRHDLTVVMGALDADPNVKVGGERTVVGANTNMEMPAGLRWVPQWFSKGLMLGRPLPHQYAWAWIVCGIFIVLYMLLALLFRGPVGACVQVLETRPGSSLLTGLLALLLFGPLLVLLLVTVIGAVLIPFLFCAAIAAYFFGKVVVYAYAGHQFVGNRMAPLLPVLVGAVLFSLLYVIPVVGFLVWGVAAPLGLGAVLLAFFARLRKEDPKPPLPTASIPPPPAAVPPGAAPAYSMTAVSPRAGFWLRFLGTAIDFALIFVICRMIHAKLPLGIVIWTVYHIAMWTFKGATIGGMAVGARIVRTDGGPIDFSVAVVRALASYLSAAAFMLGFFWAGWSAQKQSWHDIIAGTYVVKTRTALHPAPLPAPASQ